jgi:hypothetical protein
MSTINFTFRTRSLIQKSTKFQNILLILNDCESREEMTEILESRLKRFSEKIAFEIAENDILKVEKILCRILTLHIKKA